MPFLNSKRRGGGRGYGRYARTDATTARTPADHTGQRPSVAPSTNASAPTRASRNATSGRPNPSSRSSPSVSFRATGVARRRRASRTRNSAPRHSGRSGCDGFRPLVGQRLSHLRGGVAGGRERRAKLGVRRLGAGRRRDAVRVLAREMEGVPEPVERDLGPHVVEPVGRGGVAVEARERMRELRPELAHLLGVPLRRRRVRRHSWRLEHCRSLVASRPRNAGADAHCARRRG